jgi:alginate O-acetyltransferase complex protein AlgI
MLFNSFEFLIFFPAVTILFFLLPHRFRWMLLLAASCFFYTFFIPIYILILIFTIIVDYFAGILIENSRSRRKLWLICSIVANVGVLAVFKYYNFFISNVNYVTDENFVLLNIILPVGLSFHTFQALSYTIEVYRGNFKAERHIGLYALYVMFYPQLVAGPIERPQNLFPQFKTEQHFSWQNLLDGVRLMLWGFFKKLVIADRIAAYVGAIFEAPENYHPLNICIAVFFFMIQIYCDFSGYSDIALGSAKVMGYDLMINFNRPYLSNNIREFWQRWHISLSTWFRDYVYIPLGGSKKTKSRLMINIGVVFLLSGLWHGAGWNFIVWGAVHGLALIVFTLISKKLPSIPLVPWLLTTIFVAFAWIFFRATSFDNAMQVIQNLFDYGNSPAFVGSVSYNNFSYGNMNLLFSVACIAGMMLFEKYTDPKLLSLNRRPLGDIVFCSVVLILILFFGVLNEQSFIYFQF